MKEGKAKKGKKGKKGKAKGGGSSSSSDSEDDDDAKKHDETHAASGGHEKGKAKKGDKSKVNTTAKGGSSSISSSDSDRDGDTDQADPKHEMKPGGAKGKSNKPKAKGKAKGTVKDGSSSSSSSSDSEDEPSVSEATPEADQTVAKLAQDPAIVTIEGASTDKVSEEGPCDNSSGSSSSSDGEDETGVDQAASGQCHEEGVVEPGTEDDWTSWRGPEGEEDGDWSNGSESEVDEATNHFSGEMPSMPVPEGENAMSSVVIGMGEMGVDTNGESTMPRVEHISCSYDSSSGEEV